MHIFVTKVFFSTEHCMLLMSCSDFLCYMNMAFCHSNGDVGQVEMG